MDCFHTKSRDKEEKEIEKGGGRGEGEVEYCDFLNNSFGIIITTCVNVCSKWLSYIGERR